jgi:hypothetical protein
VVAVRWVVVVVLLLLVASDTGLVWPREPPHHAAAPRSRSRRKKTRTRRGPAATAYGTPPWALGVDVLRPLSLPPARLCLCLRPAAAARGSCVLSVIRWPRLAVGGCPCCCCPCCPQLRFAKLCACALPWQPWSLSPSLSLSLPLPLIPDGWWLMAPLPSECDRLCIR